LLVHCCFCCCLFSVAITNILSSCHVCFRCTIRLMLRGKSCHSNG
jgi:hypothetical protein